ncbi:MAG TPA: Fe-S cluster assembly transcription factor [Gallionella sp.]|jgi:Rrf2 family iron-sulfur cluster assembly transcriptional regulator|nr:Fe-S cluster assembly transcription factor [Gallionella sp.]
MRLTTKGRFAVTAMADLAMCASPGPVTMAAISERQKISLSYLEQLFGRLRRHKIVRSVRGPGGGYHLARPAEKITIAEIIVAVDEVVDATACGGKGNCFGDRQCITHDLWMGLNEKIYEYLSGISLQQLVDSQIGTGSGAGPIKVNKKNAKPIVISV